ncbi:hypothetical protein PFFCH_00340 [Plasmodium falciparum FCH/4]|uniref:Uncharacterized protein n=1 Tax=Plasmodium falciparum FCH/4 TaxID=1036724 RepID=A0A024VUS5_PLAFA|nr:hypothetical protein PFFCH_00340 [Plasmodium falciparum FCH/4]
MKYLIISKGINGITTKEVADSLFLTVKKTNICLNRLVKNKVIIKVPERKNKNFMYRFFDIKIYEYIQKTKHLLPLTGENMEFPSNKKKDKIETIHSDTLNNNDNNLGGKENQNVVQSKEDDTYINRSNNNKECMLINSENNLSNNNKEYILINNKNNLSNNNKEYILININK